MEIFLKFLGFLKPSGRLYVALSAACWVAIVPSRLQRLLHLNELPALYRPALSLCALVFTLLALIAAYDKGATVYKTKLLANEQALEVERQRARYVTTMTQRILRLPRSERIVLAGFLVAQQDTISLSLLSDSVDRLIDRGFITRFSAIGYRAAHKINDKIYCFIQENYSILSEEIEEIHRRIEAGEDVSAE